MLLWTIGAATAQTYTIPARTPPPEQPDGLALDRNYPPYRDAIDDGFALVSDVEILPGVVGICAPNDRMADGLGHLVAATSSTAGFAFKEWWVLRSTATIESMNTTGFVLTYLEPLAEDTEADALNAIEDLADDHVTWASTGIVNKGAPKKPSADIQSLSAGSLLTLYGFEIEQEGELRGRLLRERRDMGTNGIEWVDHFMLTSAYAALSDDDDPPAEVIPAAGVTWDDSTYGYLDSAFNAGIFAHYLLVKSVQPKKGYEYEALNDGVELSQ